MRRPEPLARRDHRHEVIERMAWDGAVLTPLDEDSMRAAARRLAAEGVAASARQAYGLGGA